MVLCIRFRGLKFSHRKSPPKASIDQRELWMITVEDLTSEMPIAERLFGRLQKVYACLPRTRCICKDPGVCCIFLPEMTVLEALQWIRLMRDMPDLELNTILRKFVEFYLTNPARLTGCPFREDGVCTIYEYRTFGCRSYGLWSQKMGRARTQNSRNSKKELKKMWKKFGLEVPADAVEFEIDYCDKVQIQSGGPIGDAGIMDLLKKVYELGKPLGDLQARFEEEYHSDFSFLLTSLLLGMKKALLLKYAVIKEITQKGTDMRLQEALGKISPQALRF